MPLAGPPSDTIEPDQCYAQSYLAPGEVLFMHWQGGGGYGDPLLRDPGAVTHDIREGKVTLEAADTVYGVIVNDTGTVDQAATARRRAEHRATRRQRSRLTREAPDRHVNVPAGRRLDDNLIEADDDGGRLIACRHCGQVLGNARTDATLALAAYEGLSTDARPQITANPADYVDAAVVFRRYCCPGCWTALHSAVVPADHADTVTALGQPLPATIG